MSSIVVLDAEVCCHDIGSGSDMFWHCVGVEVIWIIGGLFGSAVVGDTTMVVKVFACCGVCPAALIAFPSISVYIIPTATAATSMAASVFLAMATHLRFFLITEVYDKISLEVGISDSHISMVVEELVE